jgi:hypothetical protein
MSARYHQTWLAEYPMSFVLSWSPNDVEWASPIYAMPAFESPNV